MDRSQQAQREPTEQSTEPSTLSTIATLRIDPILCGNTIAFIRKKQSISQRIYESIADHNIVAAGSGYGMDILVRLLAPKLSLSLGQTVIVENRPGASGNIGVKTNFILTHSPLSRV